MTSIPSPLPGGSPFTPCRCFGRTTLVSAAFRPGVPVIEYIGLAVRNFVLAHPLPSRMSSHSDFAQKARWTLGGALTLFGVIHVELNPFSSQSIACERRGYACAASARPPAP